MKKPGNPKVNDDTLSIPYKGETPVSPGENGVGKLIPTGTSLGSPKLIEG